MYCYTKRASILKVQGPYFAYSLFYVTQQGERQKTSDKKCSRRKPIRGQTTVTANYDSIIKDGITALKVLIEPLAIADIERERKNEGEINICIFRPIYLWVIFSIRLPVRYGIIYLHKVFSVRGPLSE